MIITIGATKLSKKEWKSVTNLLFVYPLTIILIIIKGTVSGVKWLVNTISNSNNSRRQTLPKNNNSVDKNKGSNKPPLQDGKTILILMLSLVIIIAIICSAVATNNSEQSGNDENKYHQFGFDEVDGGYRMRPSYEFMNPNYEGELIIPETYNNIPVVEVQGLGSAFGRGITKIVGSENLVTIKHAAFGSRDQYEMPNLTEVIFPINSSLKTIESQAFYWQNSLKTVVLPNGIEFIGAGAFDKCYNLQNLVIYNPTPPTIERNIFIYIESSNDRVNTHPHKNFVVFVPDEAIKTYKQSEWGKYTIKGISEANFL